MPEWLQGALGVPVVDPFVVGIRLVASLVAGAAVAGIHRWARGEAVASSSFPATLVLLAVLIAMVTQVIGDNVARAFSLVGALSIVRFRTVVRDTQDTAYVIFAVAVGMALGAGASWVAALGIVVVGVAATVLRPSTDEQSGSDRFTLVIRVALGINLEDAVSAGVGLHTSGRRLMAIETTRQGTAIEATYGLALAPGTRPDTLIAALYGRDGVQSVELRRLGAQLDTDGPIS